MPTVDFSEVDTAQDYSLLPDGEYLCRIDSIDDTMTTNAGDAMWNLQMVVDDGDYRGRKVFDKIAFSRAALPRVKLLCKQLGLDVSGVSVLEPERLIGRAVHVTVEIQSYTDRYGEEKQTNKVTFAGYRKAGGPPASSPELDDYGPVGDKGTLDEDLPF